MSVISFFKSFKSILGIDKQSTYTPPATACLNVQNLSIRIHSTFLGKDLTNQERQDVAELLPYAFECITSNTKKTIAQNAKSEQDRLDALHDPKINLKAYKHIFDKVEDFFKENQNLIAEMADYKKYSLSEFNRQIRILPKVSVSSYKDEVSEAVDMIANWTVPVSKESGHRFEVEMTTMGKTPKLTNVRS